MPSEFDLIRRYFTRPTGHTKLGVGDDAALIDVTAGYELAVSTDMLVEGRHFFPDADPYALGRKALAVNLSDLAAMGATPRWFTLSLALPRFVQTWLEAFSRGLFEEAAAFDVDLIGGDTTRGPLNICIQIMGEVPAGQALRRDGARVGDDVWLSGDLGLAAVGLAALRGTLQLSDELKQRCLTRLHTPTPRVTLGLALRGLANSAIDVSDGLLADLGHILERSQVGAELEIEAIPTDAALHGRMQEIDVRDAVLGGGDDYELCFTAPVSNRQRIADLPPQLNLPLTIIGRIVAGRRLKLLDRDGRQIAVTRTGHDHFADA